MNGRRKFKRLLILFSVTALVVVSAGGFFAYRKLQLKRNFALLRAEGIAASQNGDASTTVAKLCPYLQHYGNDRDALIAYTDQRMKVESPDGANVRETLSALRYLVSIDPSLIDKRRQLLELYSEYGFPTETLVLADQILAAAPDDTAALRTRAITLTRLRRGNDAIAAAMKWRAAEPNNPEVYLTHLLALQATNASSDLTMAVAADMDKQRPNTREAQVVRAVALAINGSGDQGLRLLTDAVSGPHVPVNMLRTVRPHFEALSQYEQSTEVLRRIVLSPDAKPEEKRLLVRRFWEQERYAEALQLIDSLKIDTSVDATLLAMQAWSLRALGQTEQAEICSKKVAALKAPAADAWLAAQTSSADGELSSPKKVIDLCHEAAPQTRAYFAGFEGDAWWQLGETTQAIECWQRAADDVPSWVTPMLRLSEASANSGQLKRGLELAKQAYNRAPRRAILSLLDTWTTVVEEGQSDDIAPLEQLLDAVIKQNPDLPELLTLQIAVQASNGKVDEANQGIRTVLNSTKPLSEAVLLRLAALSSLKRLESTDALLARYQSKYGTTVPFIDVNASIAAFRKDAAAGLTTVRKLSKDLKSAEASRTTYRMLEARWAEVSKDPAAQSLWTALADENPSNPTVQRAALDVRSTRSDREFQSRTLTRLRQLSGDKATSWRLAEARLMLENAPEPKVLEYVTGSLETAIAASPGLVEAHYLLARCRELSGSSVKALESLRTATQLAPDNSLIQVALARLLQTRGDFGGSRDVLDRVVSAQGLDSQQARLVARLLATQGESNRAIELLRDNSAGATIDDKLLLTLLYRRQGELDRALSNCEQMLADPQAGLSVYALAADCYAAAGRDKDANAVLAKLQNLKLEPGVADLTMADFAMQHRSPAEAMEHARSAVKVAPSNENGWRMLISLQLQQGDGDGADQSLISAQRAVPEASALRQIREQLSVVRQALNDAAGRELSVAFTNNPADPAVREMIETLYAGGQSADLNTSLVRLRRVADRYSLSLPVQLFMLREYAQAGRLMEASAIAGRAVESFPTSPDVAELALKANLLANQWSQVAFYAKQLKQRAPSRSLEADTWTAMAAIRSGDPATAARTLEPYQSTIASSYSRYPESCTTYALALTLERRTSDVEDFLKPALLVSMEVRIAWIGASISGLEPPAATTELHRIQQLPSNSDLVSAELAQAYVELNQRSADPSLLKSAAEVLAGARPNLLTRPARLIAASTYAALGYNTAAGELYDSLLADGANDNLAQIARNNFAILLLRTNGDAGKAERLAAAAVAVEPNSADFLDTYGQALLAVGKRKESVAAFRKAGSLDPTTPARNISLAEALALNGDTAEALQLLTGLESLPNDALDEVGRGRIKALRVKLSSAASVPVETANPAQ